MPFVTQDDFARSVREDLQRMDDTYRWASIEFGSPLSLEHLIQMGKKSADGQVVSHVIKDVLYFKNICGFRAYYVGGHPTSIDSLSELRSLLHPSVVKETFIRLYHGSKNGFVDVRLDEIDKRDIYETNSGVLFYGKESDFLIENDNSTLIVRRLKDRFVPKVLVSKETICGCLTVVDSPQVLSAHNHDLYIYELGTSRQKMVRFDKGFNPAQNLPLIDGRYYLSDDDRIIKCSCRNLPGTRVHHYILCGKKNLACKYPKFYADPKCKEKVLAHFLKKRQHQQRRNSFGWYSKGKWGKIYKSLRLAGVEIEVEFNKDLPRSYLDGRERSVPSEVGIAYDGSLSNGEEYVIPPSVGDKFEDFVYETCAAAKKHGFRATSNCGLHVHLNGYHFRKNKKAMAELLVTYVLIEDAVRTLVHPERLISTKWTGSLALKYPRIMLPTILKDYEHIDNYVYRPDQMLAGDHIPKEEVERLKGLKYAKARYSSYNFHSLYYHETFEIRLLEGTVDPEKILRWAYLHSKIMRYVKNRFDFQEVKNTPRNLDGLAKLISLDQDNIDYWKSVIQRNQDNYLSTIRAMEA